MVQLLNSHCCHAGVGSFSEGTKHLNVLVSSNRSWAFWEYVRLGRGKTHTNPHFSLAFGSQWVKSNFCKSCKTLLFFTKLNICFLNSFSYLYISESEVLQQSSSSTAMEDGGHRVSSFGPAPVTECTEFLTGPADLLVQLLVVWLTVTLDSCYHSFRAVLSIFNGSSYLSR